MVFGILCGEELNLVLENSFCLVCVIVDGLGVMIGQLCELGVEGQLIGLVVIRVFLFSVDSINCEFQDMFCIVGQFFQQFCNDLIDMFGEIDVFGFNDVIDDLCELVIDLNFKESVVILGIVFVILIGIMVFGVSEVVKFIEYLGVELVFKINGVVVDDIFCFEWELVGLEKQLDVFFLEKDIGFIFISKEEIEWQIEEVCQKFQVVYDLQQSFNWGFGNISLDQGGGYDLFELFSGGSNDKVIDFIQKWVVVFQLEVEILGMMVCQEELYWVCKEGVIVVQFVVIDGFYWQIEVYEVE